MGRRFYLGLASLALMALAVIIAGRPVAADGPQAGALPSGIEAQVSLSMQAMMDRMSEMGMPPEHMEMMRGHLQQLQAELPPGVFLQLLDLMSRMNMEQMMAFCQRLHDGDLLQGPPGQIIAAAQSLVR